jgi:hypothetical protein
VLDRPRKVFVAQGGRLRYGSRAARVRRRRQGDRQQDNGSERRRLQKLTILKERSNKSKKRRGASIFSASAGVGSAIPMGQITEEEFDLPIEHLPGRFFLQVTLLAIRVLSKNAFWSVSTAMFATICQTFLLLV